LGEGKRFIKLFDNEDKLFWFLPSGVASWFANTNAPSLQRLQKQRNWVEIMNRRSKSDGQQVPLDDAIRRLEEEDRRH
jgi:hypothetical protein